MNTTIKIIITAIIAIGIGLAAGYFIFGGHQHSTSPAEKMVTDNAEESGNDTEEQIWTCSMHPQVRQNEPGLCPMCEMDLIPLESNTSNDPLVLQMTQEAVKLANIQTTIIGNEESAAGRTIRLSGKVQADERLASSQVAHVPGRIEKLYVTFTGEQVNKGRKLADLYSPELITAQRELLEALKLKDLNPGLVEAARNKLRFWKIGPDAIKAIEDKGTIQEIFPLYAQESGTVTNRRVSVGDYVKQGQPLFDLMNLGKVWVLFDAYEEDLGSVAVGNWIEFTTPSIPEKVYRSRITFIDPMINPTTRVAALRTEVSNPRGLLKPEMLVSGILQKKQESKQQLSVPKSAVLWTGKRSVVYVKVPDMEIPSFQFREVELGEGLGNSYQILKGLEPGEEVVTYGSFTIDAAAQLNNQVSMMNKEVQIKKDESGIPNYQAETPDDFKQQLHDLADAYILLKDALVATDPIAASTKAADIATQLDKIDMTLLEGEAHLYWMGQYNALQAHSNKLVELTDVEEQRQQFVFISDALIATIKAFGTIGEDLFIQYCPMAIGNQGANWIAAEQQILNPYFGDKMLKCGTVKGQLNLPVEVPSIETVNPPG